MMYVPCHFRSACAARSFESASFETKTFRAPSISHPAKVPEIPLSHSHATSRRPPLDTASRRPSYVVRETLSFVPVHERGAFEGRRHHITPDSSISHVKSASSAPSTLPRSSTSVATGVRTPSTVVKDSEPIAASFRLRGVIVTVAEFVSAS